MVESSGLIVFLSSFVALIIFHNAHSHLFSTGIQSIRHWRSVIGALVMGVGIAPFQSAAILEGLISRDVTFQRTPKTGTTPRAIYHNAPSVKRSRIAYGTIALSVYSVLGILYAIHNETGCPSPSSHLFGWIRLGWLVCCGSLFERRLLLCPLRGSIVRGFWGP